MNSGFRYGFVLITIFASLSLKGQSVLQLADSSEVFYALSPINKEKELKELVKKPGNKAFVTAFDSLYGKWFDSEKLYKKLLSQNVDDWEIDLFDARNSQIKFLKSNTDKYKIDAGFAGLVENSVKYNYWQLLLAYPILRSNNDTKFKRVVSLPRVMVQNLDLTAIDKPELMQLASYRKFLPLAITYFNSEDKQFTKYAERGKLVKDKSEFATKHISGPVLDFFNAQLVAENCPFLTPGSARYFISNVYDESYRKHLLTVCDEALNKKEVAEEKVDGKGKKKAGTLPAIMDLNDKSFDFSAYKGKVVYVDFWASWCGPCRAEFPKSKEMHESLTNKQKKDLVFLYISIDDNIDAWKSAVKQLGLAEFGENGHSFEVSARYNIRTIPRYMIIDKNGEIVEMEATRPSDPETLNSLLKLVGK